MTAPGLVHAIGFAPCTRVALHHPECVAAAVTTWIERELLAEQDRYDQTVGSAIPRDVIGGVRRRLCGDPTDLDVEPEGT